MSQSLRALLSGIVDYAGVFPPAQLSLDESIRNYAKYRTQPESWMLGRFICPAARLNELSPYVNELFKEGPPLAVSAIGRGGKDAASFRDGLRQDVNDIADFRRRHGERVMAAVIETRLPADVPAAELEDLLSSANRLTDPTGPLGMTPYFEASDVDDWPTLVLAMSAVRAATRQGRPVAGLKLRCGGIEASAFPPPVMVVFAMVCGRSTDVPLKFTAGLHHPVRRHDAGIGTMMHGFLNVFVAGVLSSALDLDALVVLEIIEDEDADDFIFNDDGLRWRNHTATVEEIEFARRTAVTSFGSCSFDEPRDDLRALGLL